MYFFAGSRGQLHKSGMFDRVVSPCSVISETDVGDFSTEQKDFLDKESTSVFFDDKVGLRRDSSRTQRSVSGDEKSMDSVAGVEAAELARVSLFESQTGRPALLRMKSPLLITEACDSFEAKIPGLVWAGMLCKHCNLKRATHSDFAPVTQARKVTLS